MEFFVDNREIEEFLSDPEAREEYEYIMAVSEMAQFVVKYGVDKVTHDLLLCAASIMTPRNFGPDGE